MIISKHVILIFLFLYIYDAFCEEIAVSYSSEINILHSTAADVPLNPNAYIMKGETLTVSVSGQIDLNHENFEVRRCSWAGLKCWYEWRSRSHWKPASEFSLTYELVDLNGKVAIKHENIRLDKQFDISFPESDEYGFSEPLRINAFITGPLIHRIECKGRPRHCSAGGLRFTVSKSEVGRRVGYFTELLKNYSTNLSSIDPVFIQSSFVMDSFLLDTAPKRDLVQKVFATEISKWKVDVSSARNIIDVAKYAASISNNDKYIAQLNTVIINGHLLRGDYSKVISEGRELMKNAKIQCESKVDDVNRSEACLEYINQLKGNATAWMEQRARYSSSEIRVAIGFMESALDIEKLRRASKHTDKTELQRLVANLSYDTAQMLLILRTPPEMDKAITYLETAKWCVTNNAKCPIS